MVKAPAANGSLAGVAYGVTPYKRRYVPTMPRNAAGGHSAGVTTEGSKWTGCD